MAQNVQSHNVQIFGHVFHDKWPKSWAIIEDPVVLLERNLYGHPLAGLLWERQFEEVLLELGWEKTPELGMSVCSSKTRISSRKNVDDDKMSGKNIAWLPCGRT